MSHLDGQYSGAALLAFVRALEGSQALIDEILAAHGLDRIEEDKWYPLATAHSIFKTVGQQIGDLGLHAIGVQTIRTSPLPPAAKDAKTTLESALWAGTTSGS